MKRIVLDPEVLLAATRTPQGASFRFLSRLGRGDFLPLISYPLLLHYEKRLRDPVHLVSARLTVDDVESLLDMWVRQSDVVTPHSSWLPQSDDLFRDLQIALAVTGKADMLITFAPRMYRPLQTFNIDTISPPAFWEKLS